MALTEAEELELLELEEAEAIAKKSKEAVAPAPAPEQPKSVYGKMAEDVKSGFTSNPNASMPLRVLQAGSGLLKGALVDAPMTAVSEGLKTLARVPGSGLSTLAYLGGKAGELVGKTPIAKANEAYQGGVNRFMERHPNVSSIDKTLGNAVQIAPFVSPALSAGGALAEKAGLSALRGEAKITNTLGQKAASTPMAGKEKIVSDVSKYDLQSTKGGFSGIADNAQAEIKSFDRMGDEALKLKQRELPDTRISLDDVMHEYENKLADDLSDIPFDQKDKAIEIKNELIAKLKKELGKDEELPAALTLLEANRARQILSKGAFKKGAYNATDPIRDQVKQDLAMSFRDAVAKYVPEQAEYNRSIRDLINVKKAAQEADARIAGHNPVMSMGNAIATGIGSAGGHALGSPALGALATLSAKNLLQSGRGASALISAGKGAKKLSELTDLSKLGNIGKNPDLDAIVKSGYMNGGEGKISAGTLTDPKQAEWLRKQESNRNNPPMAEPPAPVAPVAPKPVPESPAPIAVTSEVKKPVTKQDQIKNEAIDFFKDQLDEQQAYDKILAYTKQHGKMTDFVNNHDIKIGKGSKPIDMLARDILQEPEFRNRPGLDESLYAKSMNTDEYIDMLKEAMRREQDGDRFTIAKAKKEYEKINADREMEAQDRMMKDYIDAEVKKKIAEKMRQAEQDTDLPPF